MKVLSIAAIVLALSASDALPAPPTDWPRLREFSKEFAVDLRAPKTLVDLWLLDVGGQPRYRLVCFAGNDQANEDAGGFIYSGGLQCGLGETGTPVPIILENRSLLAADVSTHLSRAVFHADELVGACARHPEYGAIRHFRLRGFNLELRLEDLQFVPVDRDASKSDAALASNSTRDWYPLGQARFFVRVTNDPGATRPEVASIRYPYPKGAHAACTAR